MRTYKKPSTVLLKAADELEDEAKFVQGEFLCAEGKKCAVGALAFFTGDLDLYYSPKEWKELLEDNEGWGPIGVADISPEPSETFMFAIAYTHKVLYPTRHKKMFEGYIPNFPANAHFYEEPTYLDFVVDRYEVMENDIFKVNDQGKKNTSRQKIVNAFRKAADLARTDGR